MKFYFKILLLVEITVARSHKDKEQRRVYDKRYYCALCAKAQARIARHLESKHTKQDEIKDILTLDIKTATGAKEKLKRLARLRNLGNFHHNMKILKVGGELAV